MSVLIKGMEMPESCCDCPMFHLNTRCECKAGKGRFFEQEEYDLIRTGRPDGCPLVAIPKHSRVIDYDALSASFNGAKRLGVNAVQFYVDEYTIYTDGSESNG